MDEPTLNREPPPPSPAPPLAHVHPVAFALLSLGAIFLLYQVVGGGIAFLLLGGAISEANVDVVRWVTLVSQLLLILVPTLVLGILRFGSLRLAFRFDMPGIPELLASIVAVFALQQVLQVYLLAQDAIPLPETIRKFVDLLKEVFEQTYRVLVSARSPAELLLVILAVAVVPSLAEEVFFRGLIQKTLGQVTGSWNAAALAGIVFGLYHLNPLNMIPLIALGIYFGFLVHRTGSLSLAVAAHFFNNFLASIAVYYGLDEEFIALAPGAEPSAALLLATVAVFGILFVAANALIVWRTRTP